MLLASCCLRLPRSCGRSVFCVRRRGVSRSDSSSRSRGDLFLNASGGAPERPAVHNLPVFSGLTIPESGSFTTHARLAGCMRDANQHRKDIELSLARLLVVPGVEPVPGPACESTHIRCAWERRLPVGSQVGVGRASLSCSHRGGGCDSAGVLGSRRVVGIKRAGSPATWPHLGAPIWNRGHSSSEIQFRSIAVRTAQALSFERGRPEVQILQMSAGKKWSGPISRAMHKGMSLNALRI